MLGRKILGGSAGSAAGRIEAASVAVLHYGVAPGSRLRKGPAEVAQAPKHGLSLLVLACCLMVVWFPGGLAYADWFDDVRLTVDPAASYASESNGRCVACDASGWVHVVWTDYRDGAARIYYKRYDGVVWTADEKISSTTSAYPSICADGVGGVHVVWTDYGHGMGEIYYRFFDGASWGASQRLTNDPATSAYPCVAADESGRVHVVWQESRDGDLEIYHKYFDGATWGADTRLTNSTGISRYPSVDVEVAGRVHVVWHDYRSGYCEVYYKMFDGVWGSDERLTVSASASQHPSVAVDPIGRIHVVWDDDRGGAHSIYYKLHDGISWGSDEALSRVSVEPLRPAARAGVDGRVHVVWYASVGAGSEIYYKAFDGALWGPELRITKAPDDSEYPSVDVDTDGFAHVVWHDKRDGNTEIYWKKLADGPLPKPEIVSAGPSSWPRDEVATDIELSGDAFLDSALVWLMRSGEPDIKAVNIVVESSETITFDVDLSFVAEGYWDIVIQNVDAQMDTLHSGFSVVPGVWEDEARLTFANDFSSPSMANARNVAADIFGNIHVAWYDHRDGQNEIYYKKHDGSDWGPDERLTFTSTSSSHPAIVADDVGRVHVVWQDQRDGNVEIYYKEFDGAWSRDQRLTVAEGKSRYASIAVDPNNRLHVVWMDDRTGETDIFYKMFDGITWTADENISNTSWGSNYPAVAVDGSGNVHVVWTDFTGEDRVLYTKFDGVSWTEAIYLDEAFTIKCSSIWADAYDNVYVAWYFESGLHEPYEVCYRKFNGVSWEPKEQITFGQDGYCKEASIAVSDSGIVHVMYEQLRNDSTHIYYRRFDGTDWVPQVRLTPVGAAPHYPSVTTDGEGRVHVVWRDSRNGNWEIYYRMSSAAQLAGLGGECKPESGTRVNMVAPNPVRCHAEICFTLSSREHSSVSIHDICGRLVWKRDLGVMGPGMHTVIWEGTDSFGIPTAPGIYFARLRAGARTSSAKVVVVQ